MLVSQQHAGRLGERVVCPPSWQDAADHLLEHPLEAAVAGGSTYLMWRAAHGEPMPRDLVSLHRIAGFDEVEDGMVGALATLRRVERGPRMGAQRALTMAASVTAGPSIRTLATVGGNVASGFPQADLVPPLLALGAELHLHDGTRRPLVDVAERGLRTDQLITRISHELAAQDGWSGASLKLCRRGMDLSVGMVSAVLRVAGDEITDARVAVGALFERPVRMSALESALVGADPSAETMREVIDVIGVGGRRWAEDAQASGSYRARVAAPLIHRTLCLALRLGAAGVPSVTEALA